LVWFSFVCVSLVHCAYMADILDGRTEHSEWAPLSGGQTLAIGKHLRDEILIVRNEVEELRKLLGANTVLGKMRDAMDNVTGRVQALEDDRALVGDSLDSLRKECAAVGNRMAKQQQSVEELGDTTAGLRENQKVLRAGVQKVDQNVKAFGGTLDALQDEYKSVLLPEVRGMRSDMASAELAAKQMKADHDRLGKDYAETKQGLQTLGSTVDGHRGDLLKTNTVVHILEQRMLEIGKGLKETRGQVSGLDASLHELSEESNRNKAAIADLQKGGRKCEVQFKQIQEHQDSTVNQMSAVGSKLNATADTVDELRKSIRELQSDTTRLRDGQLQAQKNMQSLSGDMDEIRAETKHCMATLQETNAMVLPNLKSQNSQIDRSLTPGARRMSGTGTGLNLIRKVQSGGSPKNMSWY